MLWRVAGASGTPPDPPQPLPPAPEQTRERRVRVARSAVRQDGARYYPQRQCGVTLDPSVYTAKGRHAPCSHATDVRAKLDAKAILFGLGMFAPAVGSETSA